LSTAEVDDVCVKGEGIMNVVVAEIISIAPIPKFPKLHLLQLDAGEKTYSVVCGAENIFISKKFQRRKLEDISIVKRLLNVKLLV
jgi:tRNA-binding EMAP/Myf-like protein